MRAAVTGMDPVEFWVLFGFLLTGSVILLHRGAQTFWRLRTVTDTPTARIQSAAQGYVELAGTARPHQGPTTGALTALPCLWYRYRIEKRGGGKRKEWILVESGECPQPFRLDDGSGQCIVEPAGADLRCHHITRWTGPHRHPGNRAPTSWFQSSAAYRYTEERILEGDLLYCLGRLETPLRGAAERERLQRALLKIWKQDPTRLARFDKDGDGTLSLEEWEQAREEAGALAERSESARQRVPELPRLKATEDGRQPFLISASTEEDLAGTLRWTALGLTLGFILLAVATAWLGLARLATDG